MSNDGPFADFIQPGEYRKPAWVTDNPEDAAKAFWAARQAEYSAAEVQRPPEMDLGRHAKLPMMKLHATCDVCWQKKLDWMLAQPEGTHMRRHGERLAGIAQRMEGAGRD